MMAISTRGIGNIDAASAKTTQKSKKETSASDDFANLMNISAQFDSPSTENCFEKGVIRDAAKNEDALTSQSMKKTQADNGYKGNVASKDEKIKQDKFDEATEIPDEDVIETVASATQMLKDNLKALLGVTDEEFDSLLQENGMELSDLLNSDILKSFILYVQGATEVDALLDENIADLLSDAADILDNVLNTYDITEDILNTLQFEKVTEDSNSFLNTTELSVSDDSEIVRKDGAEKLGSNDIDEQTKEITDKDMPEGIKEISETNEINSGQSQTSNFHEGTNNKSFQNSNDTIISNLNQAIEQAFAEEINEVSSYADNVQEADVIRQLIDDIRVNLSKDATSIQVQLNPESLGRVQISVASRNGIMQARIVAETEAAKNAIEAGLENLKEVLNNHELKVEAVEVMVASYEFFEQNQEEKFEENNEQQTTSQLGSLNVNDNIDEDELNENQQLELDMMKARGNSVSYAI